MIFFFFVYTVPQIQGVTNYMQVNSSQILSQCCFPGKNPPEDWSKWHLKNRVDSPADCKSISSNCKYKQCGNCVVAKRAMLDGVCVYRLIYTPWEGIVGTVTYSTVYFLLLFWTCSETQPWQTSAWYQSTLDHIGCGCLSVFVPPVFLTTCASHHKGTEKLLIFVAGVQVSVAIETLNFQNSLSSQSQIVRFHFWQRY